MRKSDREIIERASLSVKQDQDAGSDSEHIEDGAAAPEAEMKQRHDAFQDEPYREQKHSEVLRYFHYILLGNYFNIKKLRE
jgi:hypothetical protein